MFWKTLTAVAAASLIFSCKPPQDSTEQSKSRLRYSVQGGDIPFVWKSANPKCEKNPDVPEAVKKALATAWAQAENLVQMDNENFEKSSMFSLDSVDLSVHGEQVLLFNGCIGSRGTVAGAPQLDKPVKADNCGSEFKSIQKLKQVELKPNQGCENSALAAGFAFRTASRKVSLVANWRIKNSRKPFPPEPLIFDMTTIEIEGGANGSATKIGAALLPLPEPAKGAMTSLIDQIGNVNFNAQFASAQTIVRDAVRPKNAHPASVSKLAMNIAKTILQPACRTYSNSYGLKLSCAVKSHQLAQGCSKDLDDMGRMSIVNCESLNAAQRRLYALVSKPKNENGINFLTSPGTRLTIFERTSGTDGFKKRGHATYEGNSTDFNKCDAKGALDKNKFRCIVATEGAIGGSCPQRGGGNRVLSLSEESSFGSQN